MIRLVDIDIFPPQNTDIEAVKDETKKLRKEIAELQHIMRAEGKRSLLVVLQGMDASGKDGTIKKVFSEVPPFGISVSSFKVPTKKELAHDFLWRVHKEAPEKGQIKVFNRSHYEDVLVTRVLGYTDDNTAKLRFDLINNFEAQLAHNGTEILKFYLHINYEEQEKRLLRRTQEPDKMFKHSDGDWEMRKNWFQFMSYYEDCFEHTAKVAPWHIIPVGNKRYKEYLVAKKVVETLRAMNLSYPPLDSELF